MLYAANRDNCKKKNCGFCRSSRGGCGRKQDGSVGRREAGPQRLRARRHIWLVFRLLDRTAYVSWMFNELLRYADSKKTYYRATRVDECAGKRGIVVPGTLKDVYYEPDVE